MDGKSAAEGTEKCGSYDVGAVRMDITETSDSESESSGEQRNNGHLAFDV